jgi:hypothetical protein
MHIPATIRTTYGPRSLPLSPMISVHLTMREVHDLARLLDREASEAESEGRHDIAARLAVSVSPFTRVDAEP